MTKAKAKVPAGLAKARNKVRQTGAFKKADTASRQTMLREASRRWRANNDPKHYGINQLAGKYQYSQAMLQAVPELMTIFKKAYIGEWTEDRIVAEIQNTSWFRNNSANYKQVEKQRLEQPGEYQAALDASRAKVNAFAAQVGVKLSDDDLTRAAHDQLYGNWSEAQLRQFLSGYLDADQTGGLTGEAGQTEMGLRQLAAANGVDYPDSWFKAGAKQGVELGSAGDYEQQIRNDAASKYAQWGDQIRNGANVNQLAGGYLRELENTYDMDQGTASLSDPMMQRALTAVDDQGKPTVVPLWKFGQDLRSDSRWLTTKNAGDTLGNVAQGLLQEWGFMR